MAHGQLNILPKYAVSTYSWLPIHDIELPGRDIEMPKDGSDGPHKVGFLLLQGFPLMAYAAATEPLTGVNRMTRRALYECHVFSVDGGHVLSSSDFLMPAPNTLDEDTDLDILFVCAGNNAAAVDHKPTRDRLRAMAKAGVQIGGISGGPYILARAGLLRGYRFTMHWDHFASFSEEFPDLEPTASLFELDRDR
ncbi:MAG TPA: AraC family transcriptional regulator, partial [Devosia sp.]|nr:AraC family transcriptional regulator [Devosia sp.]